MRYSVTVITSFLLYSITILLTIRVMKREYISMRYASHGVSRAVARLKIFIVYPFNECLELFSTCKPSSTCDITSVMITKPTILICTRAHLCDLIAKKFKSTKYDLEKDKKEEKKINIEWGMSFTHFIEGSKHKQNIAGSIFSSCKYWKLDQNFETK